MLTIPTVTSSNRFSGERSKTLGHGCELEEIDTHAGSSTVSSCELESRSSDGDGTGSSPLARCGNQGKTRKGRLDLKGNRLEKIAGDKRLPANLSDRCASQVPARTPLRTRLSSGAGLFIPGQYQLAAVPPPPLPPRTSGHIPIRCVIEGAFGNRLCGIHMADRQSHTEVEIVVHPKPEEMCGPWSMDIQARSRALHMLLEACKILGPQIKGLEPSVDESQLQVKYSEANSDRLCWEFGQHGYCPRHATCRWDHVAIEVFIITIVMQPLSMDFSPVAMSLAPQELPSRMVGYVIASPAGMTPTIDQVPGMMYAVPMPMDPSAFPQNFTKVPRLCTGAEPENNKRWVPQRALTSEFETSISTAAGSSERSGTITPTSAMDGSPMGSPKARSDRVCWADIEDDDYSLM